MKKYIILLVLLVTFTKCEKDVYITPPVEEPSNGFAFISSNPQGATIFLNGKNTGKVTPDSLKFIEYGSAIITLKKDGFYDSIFTCVFEKNVKNVIDVDFTKNPRMLGSINCTSNPIGAEIFLNDSSIGKITPYKITGLVPGSYNLKFKKYGYRDSESVTKVSSGETAPTYSVLQDTTKWVDYKTTNSGIASNETTSLEIDNKNNVWIGTDGKGIVVYSGTSWINFNKDNSILPSNTITTIRKDNSGNIFIGTDKGLVKYLEGVWAVYLTDNSSLPHNYISDIAVYNSEVWLATKSGLAKFENGSFIVYNSNNSLIPDNWITAVGFRNDGKLYIGTYSGGIIEKNGEDFKVLSKQSYNFPGNSITAINCDKSGNMWFGHLPTSTESGGLSYYNGTKFTTVTGLTVNKVNNIFTDINNLRWICTDDGILTIDPNFNKTFLLVQNTGLTNNFVRSVKQDKKGVIWIATFGGGVCKYKKY